MNEFEKCKRKSMSHFPGSLKNSNFKKTIHELPAANICHIKNMKKVAIEKHGRLRLQEKKMAYSSVTLPGWNVARLEKARKILAAHSMKLSHTEIILGCMKAYMPKLRLNGIHSVFPKGQSQQKWIGPKNDEIPKRTRMQNESKRNAYKKVSTYCDIDDWDVLQQTCYNARICMSHAADIALRLYLRAFVAQMLLSGSQSISMKKKLLNLGKYQKSIYYNTVNMLEIRYFFDSRPPKPFRGRQAS